MKSAIVRAVVDTNVIISSLWGKNPGKIIELWDKDKILLIVSQEILDEYFEVLDRFELSEEDIEELTLLFSNSRKTLLVKPKSKQTVIKRDPKDNKFLECALEGEAAFIISGDKDLNELGNFRGIEIVTPKKFLDLT
ncbi:MAG: putative toxin-antitoxin system toxin component, PIN family, partial [Candidatus Omnitrophica bacterium]|nr:putative toxin-antitoxin system toxin component, PIN family [Candidatus Omnitrophota bacterium]